jgi:hypothetical protein
VIEPLSPGRYRVQFTVETSTHEKLRCVQRLLRREIPTGDPAAIFDRALTLLLQKVAGKKLAQTAKPRVGRHARPAANPEKRDGRPSGHIRAHVVREVWRRDGGQCAFLAVHGRRCSERAFLELHHRSPYALGGGAGVDNISLPCRAHNQYEAVLVFGSRQARWNSPRGENQPRSASCADTVRRTPSAPAGAPG